MELEAIKILHLEDSDLDAELVSARLGHAGLLCDVTRVETRQSFCDVLEGQCPDLILSDFMLPEFSGVEALALAHRHCPDIPFIFVSGVLGEEVAIDSLRQGATDYVLKQRLDRLAPAVTRAVGEAKQKASRRLIEQALEESQRRLSLAASATALGLWYCDSPFSIVSCNERARELLGYNDTRDVACRDFLRRFDTRTRRAILEDLRLSSREGKTFDQEFPIVVSSRRVRWIRALGRFARDSEGRLIRFDGVVIDITQQREVLRNRDTLLEAERAARSELERLNQMKDQFLATLSHELRTPLNAIIGWVQLLKRDHMSEVERVRGYEVIERNAKLQAQLIADLLDISRAASGKLQLDNQEVDLKKVIEGVVEALRQAADSRGVKLLVDAPHSVHVKGDFNRLLQMLSNLLSNAIKFTESGGNASIVLKSATGLAIVEVVDTGQGIRKEFLPHLFERFLQGDSTSKRRHGGLGLGLAVVKQIAELHGGSVVGHSDGVGHGATFIVRLPRVIESQGENVGASYALPEDNALSGVRVLLVDDESSNCEIAARLLQEFGASVICAASVEEALQRFAVERPHILISDISMPDQDGFDLIRAIRAKPVLEGAGTPAIALTAFARPEDRERAMIAGFQAHVAKPIEPRLLVAAVQRILSESSQSKADEVRAGTVKKIPTR